MAELLQRSPAGIAVDHRFRCLSCGGPEYQAVLDDVPDRLMRLSGRFSYGKCARCNLVQIREVPADLGQYYAGYGRHSKESRAYAFFRRVVTGRCYSFPRGLGRRLLDVGSGNGWYLQARTRRGWVATGYELDAAHANDLSRQIGLPVMSELQQLKRDSDRFDLATFNFSLEHLAQPRQTLEAVSDALKPGGQVIIVVPNFQSREARIFGRKWFHLDAPRHITFYSKDQLAKLLTETGFKDVQFTDIPVATEFAGSLSYLIFGYLHPLVWYPAILPGMLFSLLVRDGNFRVSAVKA